MGSTVSTAMDENLKKNQAFMKETQQLQLGRQMQMQTQMQRRQMSMMLAGSREMFMWLASFYGIATVGMFAGYMKTKNPAVIAPFLPLSFIVGYQADYAYGNKIDRIRDEAERIMREEPRLLSLPYGLPTFQDIEEGRKAAENKATK
ncbi:plasminogen receptor (KT) [Exaiptasia diaphana]|uniref:Plasminogen receptor (KT) n=1 Tax=Exaiptasia diaphana TaxID=2652724 RepID=A0A913XYX2_EXADI|nr:plasminogen receptor (KT) [Exaiptasia diaphana]XP_020911439.1 plasminogen receptor (KT) [Exaiptasia diaphana]XP_020911440.1 plasminogen receptor (KT) [Exaiptasia diaphana]XP_028518020.1 plasminogen receptor (KT) [Exaiptasia diaphana]XP_028518021.1 plasminogen receptor (KT) [Exaiptasia diaphana]XP_028518022.1 plasminogen receptor (KT) [Exaiptasia diaphana]KXJ24040.1 Plasminogen receptor (KT) [Exaiptasia diaphana]